MTNIPPQAYTREDLAKAYIWVQSQPEHIKKMAANKETLVSLYLQARRGTTSTIGTYSVDTAAPVSSRNFKNQLQSLANELNQFESNQGITDFEPENPNLNRPIPHFADTHTVEKKSSASNHSSNQYDERSIELKVSERVLSTPNSSIKMDSKSQEIINIVKNQLNIESEQEVIRMLLVLGFDRLKAVFPDRN